MSAATAAVASARMRAAKTAKTPPKQSEFLPRRIPFLNGLAIKDVAAGGRHALIATEFGDIFAWGRCVHKINNSLLALTHMTNSHD